jgi:hypothetical protein
MPYRRRCGSREWEGRAGKVCAFCAKSEGNHIPGWSIVDVLKQLWSLISMLSFLFLHCDSLIQLHPPNKCVNSPNQL